MPGYSDYPKRYPVINIYHHRRTADDPTEQHVVGDPIPVNFQKLQAINCLLRVF